MRIYQRDNDYPREGKLEDRYQVYRECADDGTGHDRTTGKWLLTFDEWLGL